MTPDPRERPPHFPLVAVWHWPRLLIGVLIVIGLFAGTICWLPMLESYLRPPIPAMAAPALQALPYLAGSTTGISQTASPNEQRGE